MQKRLSLLLVTCFASFFLYSQKGGSIKVAVPYTNRAAAATFSKLKIEGDNNSSNVAALLIKILPNLQDEKITIKLNYVNKSLAGLHYSFTQLYNGVAVYQSEIKINTDNFNTVRSVFDNSYNTKGWNLTAPVNYTNPVIAIDPATDNAVVADLSIVNHTEILRANGIVIFERDLNSYYLPKDSLVTGKVFNPDPLTTSQHYYTDVASITGADTIYYDNNNGLDEPWMDAQQQTVSFRAMFNDTIFSLASPYVVLTNYDTAAPDVPPVTSLTPQFFFNRAQSGFQDVNAFYHISTHRNYVASLGFNCADSLILIDTHALSADNSYFSPDDYPRRIYYGVGGVPDAEDADVVVHEYCHSLSYNAAPGSNVGRERTSLDEAFCDYNAAAYSKALSTFNDEWIYNWDGHNQYWSGRIMNSTGVYPANLGLNIYTNGEMWSAVLFSLNGDLGRGVTDSLIIQTHYSYAQNITMAHAALLLIDADSLLFNGAHYCAIYERLLQHGFVSATNNGCAAISGIQNTTDNNFGFIQNGNSYTVLNRDNLKIKIQLLNITGQQVENPVNTQQVNYYYQNVNLATGIYLVNIISETGSATYKWVNAAH